MLTADITQRLANAEDAFTFVLVPGLRDSGEEHWQSYWERRFPHWHRIRQKEWQEANLDRWSLAIRRELTTCPHPAILIGHSFGALASCHAVQQGVEGIAGVMLVAPAEPLRFEIEERIQAQTLSVPSIVFASHNDPLMTFSRAEHWSRAWGSDLVDVGEGGHINAEAGFGPWEYGLVRLEQFATALMPTV